MLFLITIRSVAVGGDVLLQQSDLALELATRGGKIELLTVDDRFDLQIINVVADGVGKGEFGRR